MPDRFETAHKRARERIGIDKWVYLPTADKEREVAEEMRKMDEEAGRGDLRFPV
jgi:hypothetical protein